MRILLGLAMVCAALGADSDFNGRWLIEGDNEPRIRAWSLEVKGAGTSSPGGSFVTAYWGDRNIIKDMTIRDGELRFSFERERDEKTKEKETVVYKARLVDGKLRGTYEVTDGKWAPMKWVGWRAPVLSDKDDGKWVEGTPVALFDGKSAAAFEPNDGWAVSGGILKNNPGVRDIVTRDKFWNFRLIAEYRLGPHSNSGIALRGRYEVQIVDDYGKPPESHGHGSIYSRIAPKVNASKPAGEWQTLDIRLVGRDVTVKLNGKMLIDRQEVEGLTAMASNPYEDQPGPLVIQGDHGSVEIRKLTLIPLTR